MSLALTLVKVALLFVETSGALPPVYGHGANGGWWWRWPSSLFSFKTFANGSKAAGLEKKIVSGMLKSRFVVLTLFF